MFMKKLLFIAMLTLTFFSCEDTDLLMESCTNADNPDKENVSTVIIENGKICETKSRSQGNGHRAICFKDNKSFIDFISKMEVLSDEERINVLSNYEVSSLHTIALLADSELENIGNHAASETEFRTLYGLFIDKYKDQLITNNMDSTDLELYVPEGDNIMTFIANESKEYVVGDKVITLSLNNELPQYTQRMYAAEYSSSSNTSPDYNTDVYSPIDGKKIYFDAYMIGERMWVKMHARKKMWYGWKNDPNRTYFFDSYLSMNFQYLSQGANGQEIVVSPLPRYVFNQNVENGFNIILGRINGGVNITGQIKTWCNYTSEHDSDGNQLTEIKDGVVVPKCLDSKARIVNIYLVPQL